MGLFEENKENYNKSAVLTYASSLKRPVLISHSTSDDNVHVRKSMQLVNTLINHGIDHELKLYQMGGHGIAHDFKSNVLLQVVYLKSSLFKFRLTL
jgi:dipeptidyl-peptidase 4